MKELHLISSRGVELHQYTRETVLPYQKTTDQLHLHLTWSNYSRRSSGNMLFTTLTSKICSTHHNMVSGQAAHACHNSSPTMIR